MRISDWSSDVCSSDLQMSVLVQMPASTAAQEQPHGPYRAADPSACAARYAPSICGRASSVRRTAAPSVSVSIAVSLMPRSEEHTSELQSLMRISYAVFCLKKKNTRQQNDMPQTRVSNNNIRY